ncbi:MAG: hypothetical protein QOH96_244 [Blastocatellia bacterium]|nr:hypothetical protein [Blastocatellia bacterium]
MKQKIKGNRMSNKDELAQVIATLGLVTRQGSRFVVKSPTLHGQTSDFEVWRDEAGKIRCSCLENDDREGISDRCEHILSVKHALTKEMAVVKEAGETERAGTQDEVSMKPTSAPIAQPLQFSSSFRVLNEEESSSGRMPDRRTEESRVLGQIDDAGWQAAADILDGVAPKWSYSVRAVQLVGNMIVVIVSVTVDGVTREGIGAGSGELEVALRTAEDEALKRAANKFGFARLQAHSSTELVEQKIASKDVGGFPCDPQARSMAELVMPRQLGIMRALARESGVDADKESMQVLHCKTEELSKRAASSFIEYLQLLPFKKSDRLRKAS